MRKKAELFDTLNKVLNQYAQSTKSVEPKTDSKIVFKMPIEGHVENIGAYSPGARTDARHAHHDGVDLHAPRGTKAFSIAPGVVTSINSDAVGGNNIVITHDQGYKSYYAHLDSISDEAIKSYQNKSKITNESIGTVGNTGNANVTAPHIHLQVWRNGSLIDPASILSIPKPNMKFMKEYSLKTEKPSSNFSLKNKLKEQSKVAYINYLFSKIKQ